MRGIYTSVTKIRRKIFTEVARLAYEGGNYAEKIEKLPYKIIPGEIATYRESIFLERAIVGERLRLSIGLPLSPVDDNVNLSDGIEESAIAEKYYDPPLVNIISFACNSCPENVFKTTDLCQACLAHPCSVVCPVDAVSIVESGKSVIDQEKCIKCGRCRAVCPYDAIQKLERPCAKACGVNAIYSDEHGRAKINYDLCVSCGMCIVNCPFGAISDKGQIFQLIHAINSGCKVIAAIAPSFLGQFGPSASHDKIKQAMRQLGISDVVEVAIGADLCAIEEAHDFLEKVPSSQPFMATSCCPAWSVMAKKNFPEFEPYISMTLTPMVLTARLIKKEHKDCKVVFIGPCAAKKLEASRRAVRSDVDFVLTFEEVMGMFKARDVDFDKISTIEPLDEATSTGRGFAVSGGVVKGVIDCIKKIDPDREILTDSAEGLDACKKMLLLAKANKRNGYILEGMACPGGCVAGTGTLQPVAKSASAVNKYKLQASEKDAFNSKYKDEIKHLS